MRKDYVNVNVKVETRDKLKRLARREKRTMIAMIEILIQEREEKWIPK